MGSSEVSLPSGHVPFHRYAPVVKRAIEPFAKCERIFFSLSYTIALTSLFCQTLATLLHLQTSESLLFESAHSAQRLGYSIGLAATFFAGAQALLPFSKGASECRDLTSTLARYIVSREDMPVSVVARIYAVDTLCFRHPTSSIDCCSIQELYAEEVAQLVPATGNGKRRPGATYHHAMLITYERYSETLLRASHEFNRLSQQFFLVYYLIAAVQLLFTAATAVLHGNVGTLLGGPGAANLTGLLCGFVGTVAGGIVSVVPVEVAAHRCRSSYSLCCEYLLSEAPMAPVVFETLHQTPCLCFTNPMLHPGCATLLETNA